MNIKMFSSSVFIQVRAYILIQISEPNYFIESFNPRAFKSTSEKVNAKRKWGNISRMLGWARKTLPLLLWAFVSLWGCFYVIHKNNDLKFQIFIDDVIRGLWQKGLYHFDFIEKQFFCNGKSDEKLCTLIFGNSNHVSDFLRARTHVHRNARKLSGINTILWFLAQLLLFFNIEQTPVHLDSGVVPTLRT